MANVTVSGQPPEREFTWSQAILLNSLTLVTCMVPNISRNQQVKNVCVHFLQPFTTLNKIRLDNL